jgi:hypothetical protein
MPRRRVSSSFFDSSSLPDLSTSLSIAASGGSGSPTTQKNAPSQLVDEDPISVDEEEYGEDSEDYEELRSWLDCVAASGDVARMRRADRLAPRLSEYDLEGLEDITGVRKGSWSTSWYHGVWPPAAASSTCGPEAQENDHPDEVTWTGKDKRDESRPPSRNSGFVAESTLAELQPPTLHSTSEATTPEAGESATPALIIEDLSTGTGDTKPSPHTSARLSNSPMRQSLIRWSFAASQSNTIVPKKQKPVSGLDFKRKASKSFRKLLGVFGVRERPTAL